MRFKPFVVPFLEKLERDEWHEAGHLGWAKEINPKIRYTIGLADDEPFVQFNLEDFAKLSGDEKYEIAVAGCLAEAKGLARSGEIRVVDLDDTINLICKNVGDNAKPWQVDIPIVNAAGTEPAACNCQDFTWLGKERPDWKKLGTATVKVAHALNEPDVWLRIRRWKWGLNFAEMRPQA